MEMNAAKRMEPETFQSVEQWCKDMQNMRPKSWENVNLGHLTVDYKVSKGDIKWILKNSVKMATFVKKL